MRDHADDDRRPLNPAWRAEDYERGRPGWPGELVDDALAQLGLDRDATVLDLAAGTGKLTRVLAERVNRVVAVEPDPAMRAVHGCAVEGTAEAIPLPDASVDAVFVAEAWHWFDAEAAIAEVRRVLHPGGGLALLWHAEAENVPLGPLRALVEEVVVPKKRVYDSGSWKAPVERVFGPMTLLTAEHDHALDADGYVALVSSWSWVAALPDAEREAALAEIRQDVVIRYGAEAWVSRGSPA